jgi:hypothetical protein
MKFNPLNWNEVTRNEEFQVPKGRLLLRLSAPCPLYAQAYGVEALVGVQTDFQVELAEEMTCHFVAPDGVRGFVYVPERSVCAPDAEVFTNIDRMPNESGSVAAVTQALRQIRLAERESLGRLRQEAAKVRAASKPVEPAADPVLEKPVDPPADEPAE